MTELAEIWEFEARPEDEWPDGAVGKPRLSKRKAGVASTLDHKNPCTLAGKDCPQRGSLDAGSAYDYVLMVRSTHRYFSI